MSVSVDLKFPVQFDGRDIKTLGFRRMKAKDALIAEGEGNQTRAGYLLFAALAGVDVKVIEELDIEDLEAISEAIVPLMGKSAARALSEETLKASLSDGATSSSALPGTGTPRSM